MYFHVHLNFYAEIHLIRYVPCHLWLKHSRMLRLPWAIDVYGMILVVVKYWAGDSGVVRTCPKVVDMRNTLDNADMPNAAEVDILVSAASVVAYYT